MDERRAREVTLLEAFETAAPASPSWSDDDRLWADRVASEAAGGDTDVDKFIAGRASHAMHRLRERERERGLARELVKPAWRRGAVVVVALVAFACGVAIDELGGGRLINLLAPPFWAVLVWNVVVYLWIVVAPLVRVARRRPARPRPLLDMASRLGEPRLRSGANGGGLARLWRGRPGGLGDAPASPAKGVHQARRRFAALWLARKRSLSMLRAQVLLHAAAAALGLGLVAGMYARGLVLDYRVVWESTFIDAPAAHAIVATALAPAAAISGIALPDAASFAALRSTPGAASAGAPAAPWLHLLGLTMAIFVVVPRALLASVCAALAARRSRRFALPLGEPYFQRLARLATGGAAHVVVFPFATAPSPQSTLRLQALAAEAFGPRVDLRVEPMVAFGAEDDALAPPTAPTTHAIALFDASATPEAEHHGAFLATVARALPAGAALAALVDEAGFIRRFAHLAERTTQRRAAWHAFAEARGIAVVIVDLGAAGADDLGSAGPAEAIGGASTRAAVASGVASPSARGVDAGETSAGAASSAARQRAAAALQSAFAAPRPAGASP